jgi:hypothetical protein
MRQCTFTKPDGERCKLAAHGSQDVCWHHDPKNASERRRTASRGGRGRVNTETRAVKKLMDDLTAKVLAGEIEPAVSHAVVALQNIKLRAIETERKLEEADVRAEWEEVKRDLGISS